MEAEVVYISSDDESDDDVGMCESLPFRLLCLSVVCPVSDLGRVREQEYDVRFCFGAPK